MQLPAGLRYPAGRLPKSVDIRPMVEGTSGSSRTVVFVGPMGMALGGGGARRQLLPVAFGLPLPSRLCEPVNYPDAEILRLELEPHGEINRTHMFGDAADGNEVDSGFGDFANS